MQRVLLPILMCFAALSYTVRADDGPWSISPATPKAGEEVTIHYNAASPAAKFQDAPEITGEVMVFPWPFDPVLIEVPLARTGGRAWSGTCRLPGTGEALLMFRFASGDSIDDQGGNVWTSYVYGVDGRPVRNAHYTMNFPLRGWNIGGFKHAKDLRRLKTELLSELQLYPDNLMAMQEHWSVMLEESPGDSTIGEIKKELESAYRDHANDTLATLTFVDWFGKTGQQKRADEVNAAALAANPRGSYARHMAEREFSLERDPLKRRQKIEEILRKFGDVLENRDAYLTSMARAFHSLKDYRAEDSVLALIQHPPLILTGLYNGRAWDLLEKGGDPVEAVRLAHKAIEILNSQDASDKPKTISRKSWERSGRENRAMILDTYGLALYKLSRFDEAYSAYAEADSLMAEKDLGMVQRLIQAADKAGKTDRVLALSERSIRTGFSNDEILSMYVKAYRTEHASDADLESRIASLKAIAEKDAREALMKSRIDRPAPAFDVKAVDGTAVSLASCKGKVVVLDFWATWCGPCKVSMPFLQKTYEKYKANPRVAFYAVNVWERQTGEELTALVKAFLEQNKYTFPVLYGGDMAERFGVDGIPTKFVLDQQGKIQFKGVGSEGEEMVAKLSSQIDLLLGHH